MLVDWTGIVAVMRKIIYTGSTGHPACLLMCAVGIFTICMGMPGAARCL